jgi:hypothetical protein
MTPTWVAVTLGKSGDVETHPGFVEVLPVVPTRRHDVDHLPLPPVVR